MMRLLIATCAPFGWVLMLMDAHARSISAAE